MILQLNRHPSGPQGTPGELFLDGAFQCFTLEGPVRDLGADGSGKVPGDTAIPAGTYAWGITHSERFNEDLVLLQNVPYFTGIRIHAGNTKADTEGCILVGKVLRNLPDGTPLLLMSRVALTELMGKLRGHSGTLHIQCA